MNNMLDLHDKCANIEDWILGVKHYTHFHVEYNKEYEPDYKY